MTRVKEYTVNLRHAWTIVAAAALITGTVLSSGAMAQEAPRNLSLSYDFPTTAEGFPLGVTVHGDSSLPWEPMTLTVALSHIRVSGSEVVEGTGTQTFVGAGPGIRIPANDRLEFVAHFLVGYLKETISVSSGSGNYGFLEEFGFEESASGFEESASGVKGRLGAGVDYGVSDGMRFRVMFEYVTEPHLVAGIGFGF